MIYDQNEYHRLHRKLKRTREQQALIIDQLLKSLFQLPRSENADQERKQATEVIYATWKNHQVEIGAIIQEFQRLFTGKSDGIEVTFPVIGNDDPFDNPEVARMQ